MSCADTDVSKLWHGLQDGYSQSKWVAEQLVADMRDKGLPVVIYRPGNLAGSTRITPEVLPWSQRDFNLLFVTGCIRLGSFPDSIGLNLEMTPVDFAAEVIVSLTRSIWALGRTFHLVNTQPISAQHLFTTIRQLGYSGLQPAVFDHWRTKVLGSVATELADLRRITETLKEEVDLVNESTFERTNLDEALATEMVSE